MEWLIVIVLVVLGLVVYGLVEPYWLDVRGISAEIPNLPDAWQGRKLAFLSDFQVGMWLNNERTDQRALAKVVELGVEALLFGGDFLYDDNQDVQEQINVNLRLFKPVLEAGIPIIAVFGNHDYMLDEDGGEMDDEPVERLASQLKRAGVIVLRNELTYLEADGEKLCVIGADSAWAKRDDVTDILERVSADTPRVVLIHNPSTFLKFPNHTAPFAIAGHTHGSQIHIPKVPAHRLLGVLKEDELSIRGWQEPAAGEDGNRMYVNRGIGFSMLPVRINARPELTIIELKRANSREPSGSVG